jgi:hypothetical protein
VKIIFSLFLITNAFAQDDLSKAFGKRTEKSCTQELSEIRKYARTKVNLLDKIEKVEIGKNKDSKFALLYLKLKDGVICSEQPEKNPSNIMLIRYICRDKKGLTTLDKNVETGPSECAGDAPKFN